MSMEKSPYKRKTNSPKMGWSDERRAKFSAKCRESHANNTWFKKSKKVVGRNISNGLKNAAKFRNRSEAMKQSWERRRAAKAIMNHPPTTLSENLLDSAPLPFEEKINPPEEINPPEITTSTEQDLIKMLELLEKYLGYKLTVKEFTEQAVKEKMYRVAAVFNPDKRYLLFGDFKGGDQ